MKLWRLRNAALAVLTLGLMTALAAGPSFARRGGAGRGGARMPFYRPPMMPMYRGRVLRVPHLSVGVGAPRPRVAMPAASAGRPWRPSVAAPREPQPASGSGHITFLRPQAAVAAPPRESRPGFLKPRVDQNGKPLSAEPIRDLTKNAAVVHESLGAPAFVKGVSSFVQDASERDGQFHWHQDNGVWVSHWYDRGHGQDWVGVYQGGRAFWTIYWHSHFWWKEPQSGRWVSYWRDHWWWHSPQGAYYVFIDGQFYAWNPNANDVTLVQGLPALGPLPVNTQPASGEETMVVSNRPEFTYSADGTRMVQVEGEELSAYLWDLTRKDAQGGDVMLKFLGEGVTAVSFSDASRGPMRITLSLQDATGAVHEETLDADGNLVTGAPVQEAAVAQPAYGTPGPAGFDAPGGDLPPIDSPQPDGN